MSRILAGYRHRVMIVKGYESWFLPLKLATAETRT